MDLTAKKCVPCEGGTPPLTRERAEEYLRDVPGWELMGERMIRRQWKFKNFKEAMAFVNRVAELAESEGHHPNIHLTGWNRVTLELSTHAIKGLSENDFIMAAKVNELEIGD